MKASTITALFQPEPETTLPGVGAAVTKGMRRQSVWLAIALPVLLTLLLGCLDAATGWEISLFIFYALPITLAVWWIGTKAGLFIALLAGVVWWVANEGAQPYETSLGYFWAVVNREFYFGVVVVAVTVVRNKQEADAAHIQMLEERRRLEQDIVAVSEHEQQRIGQDLHDGLCQHLAAIGCAARVLAEDLQAQKVSEARDAVMIEESIQQAVLEARNLARGIFPVHVDRSGLAAALVDLGKMMHRLTGIAIVVKDCVDVPLDAPEVSMHLYRIAQEAVANAVKHSGASEITVAMKLSGGELELRVADNGSGMPSPRMRGEGMGLRTMRYRAQAIPANLEITPRSAGGTLVCCRLQLHHLRDHENHC